MKSVRTRDYQKKAAKLPPGIRDSAEDLYKVFKANPQDERLCTEDLHNSRRGRHRQGSFSVRINLQYRAIYVIDNGKDGGQESQHCWYWIGSHQDYNVFIGSRRR